MTRGSVDSGPMIWPRRLLWIDAFAGLAAGVVVLLAASWLSRLHNLPPGLLYVMGAANLTYGIYALQLALRRKRPRLMIYILVLGNTTWTLLCLSWVMAFSDTISIWGLGHFICGVSGVIGMALA